MFGTIKSDLEHRECWKILWRRDFVRRRVFSSTFHNLHSLFDVITTDVKLSPMLFSNWHCDFYLLFNMCVRLARLANSHHLWWQHSWSLLKSFVEAARRPLVRVENMYGHDLLTTGGPFNGHRQLRDHWQPCMTWSVHNPRVSQHQLRVNHTSAASTRDFPRASTAGWVPDG